MVKCHEKPAYLEILCDFTNEALEGGPANEELRRFLVMLCLTVSGRKRWSFLALPAVACGRETMKGRISGKAMRMHTAVLRVAEDLAASCLRGALLAATFIGSEWKERFEGYILYHQYQEGDRVCCQP